MRDRSAMLLSCCGLGILVLLSGCGGGGGGPPSIFVSGTGNDVTGTGNAASPYASIALALSASGGSGTIQLEAGTYTEDVTLPLGVTLLGRGQGSTFLAGTGSGPAVQFVSGVGAPARLQDLTVRGGAAAVDGATPAGSALHIVDASPIIENVTLTSAQTVGSQGAALGVFGTGSVRLTGVTIDASGPGVHGLFVAGSASVEATDLTVSGNGADGIHVSGSARVTVRGGTVAGNANGIAVVGGGTFHGEGLAVRSHATGSGLTASDSATVELVNCLFYDNQVGLTAANRTGAFGLNHVTITANLTGLNDLATVALAVYNSILWSNAVNYTPGFTPAEAINSNVPGFAGTGGNIAADPQFVNAAAKDFHLRVSSPCRNAGTFTGLPEAISVAWDFDGDLRPIDGTPDIGADEETSTRPAVQILDTEVFVTEQSRDVRIDFVVSDFEGEPVDLLVEVKGGPVEAYTAATIKSASGGTNSGGTIRGLLTVRGGLRYSFVWDSLADVWTDTVHKRFTDVTLRLTPTDTLRGTPAITPEMAIHNSPSTPDPLEDNDNITFPAVITAGVYPDLTVWKQDFDFYKITVPEGARIRATAVYTNSHPNKYVGFVMELMDAKTDRLLRYLSYFGSLTVDSYMENVTGPLAAGDYYLKIWLVAWAEDGTHYDLTVSVTTAPTPRPQ